MTDQELEEYEQSLLLTKNKIRCLELALLHVVIEFFGVVNCLKNNDIHNS